MSEEIINRVANSGLITLDLSEYKNDKEIKEFRKNGICNKTTIFYCASNT